MQSGSDLLGTLAMGSYVESGNGKFDPQIGGSLAGQYDVLNANSPASSHGSGIQISLFNNFQPQVGDKFDILRTQTPGPVGFRSLAPFLLPPLPKGEFWGKTNFGSFFELSVRQLLPPGPVVSSPEPGSLLLTGFGLAWLVAWRWRKQAQKAKN